MQDTSVGIIGTGWVGTSVAISTLHVAAARHLLLHDRREAVAEGEAMDLSQGSSFYPSADVSHASLDEMRQTSVVVVAAGRGGSADESRLRLLEDNARIVGDLAEHFQGYDGMVVIVTNPVDVLTHVFQRKSGLPRERVIGTGTMLDTARLREALGRELELDPRSVHAQVIGEHGDSEVCVWSSATVGGKSIRSWPGWSAHMEEKVAREVREAAYRIIQRKGSTNHAIGLVTADLLRGMLRDERRVLTVSRVQDGAFGISGVALSLPTVVGVSGATEVLEPELDHTEREGLRRSASVLQEAIGSLQD
jgi:L-lactate dehydrogenase